MTTALATSNRAIVYRTLGSKHGPITRLMSPSDLGERLKPFVFLDYFESEPGAFGGFGMHPHSGIATLTWLLEGASNYEDSSGESGELVAGGWWRLAHRRPRGQQPHAGLPAVGGFAVHT